MLVEGFVEGDGLGEGLDGVGEALDGVGDALLEAASLELGLLGLSGSAVEVELGHGSVRGGCDRQLRFGKGVGGEGSSNRNVDARRCFSMGSFAYVMDESSSLQVPIRSSTKKQSRKKPSLPLEPGHRQAMSECDCESRREFKFNGAEAIGSLETQGTNSASITSGNGIGRSKRESYSISKIWLRGKKEKPNVVGADLSRRAFSFRFPGHRAGADESKAKNGGGSRRTISEIDIGRWENGGNEVNFSGNSLDSQSNPPSFARRTLLWLMGRQNKVVHSSLDPTV